ncbi:MAG: hypothetical protein P8O74_08510 [Paracoccaceae bacterium]|jgi:uncharacterized alpha/beta hydrolase family protein|nr:hypothetical protein [Paracoccaceae bacterium]MDG0987473.1 hypothetical protein [Paracoccaceae bacterium]MDG1675703.1 hypothetical protein [Paracoccaceae bacterium]MDG2248930.1 hypothetical protein [Paracoccaceae bacterium]|tara:strand:- start:192 stop:404 length:213 start_codon:yes stop_codon:yes gene_type:complete
MEILIWIGSILSILGLVGLFWCIKTVLTAKKNATSDEQLRDSLQKIVPLNMAALFLSAIGLMLVILGIIL